MRREPSQVSGQEDLWLLDETVVDEFMVREDERTVSKEDAKRLKKVRYDATQEVFVQSAHHKGTFKISYGSFVYFSLIKILKCYAAFTLNSDKCAIA